MVTDREKIKQIISNEDSRKRIFLFKKPDCWFGVICNENGTIKKALFYV